MSTDTMKTELKPCPFCGGRAYLRELVEHDLSGDGDQDGSYSAWFHIGCLVCGIEVGGEYEHEAIAAWNRRAALDSQAAQAQPSGWKLVPIEPTEEMWTAGRDPIMYRDVGYKVLASMEAPPWRINPATGEVEKDQSKGTTAVHVWRAMIAASPSHSKEPGDEAPPITWSGDVKVETGEL